MSLNKLSLQVKYFKYNDNFSIADDFFVPCLENSIKYNRITGYFASSAYLIAWSGLRKFIENEGKLKIITSPNLTEQDIKELNAVDNEERSEFIQLKIKKEIDEFLENGSYIETSILLSSLYKDGILEFKIADFDKTDNLGSSHTRMMHDKTGIFIDKYENIVSFNGGVNETFQGLSNDGNFDSVDVSVSWEGGRDEKRTKLDFNTFEKIWNNKISKINVQKFSEYNKEKLFQNALSKNGYLDFLSKIEEKITKKNNKKIINNITNKKQNKKEKLNLWDFQEKSISLWKNNNYFGILKLMTGTGKTYTAIYAIKEMLEKKLTPLILVPSGALMDQWEDEIKKQIDNLIIIKCGNQNNTWRRNLYFALKPREEVKFLILAIMDTAQGKDFMNHLSNCINLFLIADEVHNLGAPENSKLLDLNFGAKLGLSATPEREGPNGTRETERIITSFKKIVHEIDLHEAIHIHKVLSRYRYEPYFLNLTDQEEEVYRNLTQRISRMIGINPNSIENNSVKKIIYGKS